MLKRKDKFYTDLNLINLPIFTTSKRIKRKTETEEITHELGNVKYNLKISYPEKKLTFYDRNILGAIEYIYSKQVDFNMIQSELETLIEDETKKYMKDNKIKNIDDLSESEKQQISFSCSKILSNKYRINCRMSDINKIIPSNNYQHSEIKNSLLKLGSTIIHKTSTYFVDQSILEIPSIPFLDVTISKNKNRDIANINLNAFHFINLIYNRSILSDFKLLNSFKSQIAGRLSEYLSKSLYGSKKFKKDKAIYFYQELCNYLQIEPRKSKSQVLQQLSKPFSELIDKQIIVNWTIEKTLFKNDYELCFYHSFDFYEKYYHNLDDFTKKEISTGLNKIFLDDNLYTDFINERDTYLETIKNKIDKKEFRDIRQYYTYFLYLTAYNRPIPATQQATTEQKELF